jgi:hypothetical protein
MTDDNIISFSSRREAELLRHAFDVERLPGVVRDLSDGAAGVHGGGL